MKQTVWYRLDVFSQGGSKKIAIGFYDNMVDAMKCLETYTNSGYFVDVTRMVCTETLVCDSHDV